MTRLRTRLWVLALALAPACGQEPRRRPPEAGPETATTQRAAPPNFAEHVAPILHEHCAGCHHPSGPAPFALHDYDDARDHAEQIVEVTHSGYMPPWLPREGYARFADARGLSPRERETLAAWVAADRPPGDLAAAPEPPTFDPGWQLGEPDLLLRAEAAWTVPADGPDIYRNFVIRVPEGPLRFIKTVELRPGPQQVVHHAVMRVDATGEARRSVEGGAGERAGDSGASFEGMVVPGARMPGGRFVGWTPGRVPDPGDEARSWPLLGGSDLVVQLHLRPTGKAEQVQPELGLHFAAGPPKRPSLALVLSSTNIDIPAGERNYAVVETFELPVAVRALSVYPHAHYIATTIEAWATLPDGRREWLLAIDDWDFNWQDQYRYAHPVELPAGSVITLSHRYDNSADNPRNPSSPPQRVRFGPASTDEMAELILEVEPRNPAELAVLDRALEQRWLQVQVDTVARSLAAAPEDAALLANLASLHAHAGRPQQARAVYERALAARPAAGTHVDYAIVLHQLGELEAARAQLEAALKLEPAHARAHLVRGNHRREAGELEAAEAAYERARAADPDLVEAHNNLGVTLEQLGRFAEAVDCFTRAVELAPARARFRLNLGRARERSGDADGAIAAYRATLERDGSSIEAMRGLAWLLATHPDPARRDPEEALRVAELGNRLTKGRSPELLEALAAALAARGDSEPARRALVGAIELAQLAGREDLVARYQQQLQRLAAGEVLGDPR